MSNFNEFLTIRAKYAKVLPRWMAEYKATGRMHHDPYIIDWVPAFTPIEQAVWGDIRSSGMPFYPQIPVLNYFIDFGCPMLKIGIECDGKAWHDSARDKIRDARLAEAGWNIFRIEGHECNRVLPDPWEREEYDEADSTALNAWFCTTSEGILCAINARYFKDQQSKLAIHNESYITRTLFEHNTTPSVYTSNPRPVTASPPSLVGDSAEKFAEEIMRELTEDHE